MYDMQGFVHFEI